MIAMSCVRPSWRSFRRRRSEEHTSELQSRQYLVCRLLLEKKKKNNLPTVQFVFVASRWPQTVIVPACAGRLEQHHDVRIERQSRTPGHRGSHRHLLRGGRV